MRETAQTRVASLFFRSRVSVLQKVGERTEFVLIELIEKAMYRTLLALSLRTKAARSLVVTSPLQKTTRFFLTFVVVRKKRSVREVNHFARES